MIDCSFCVHRFPSTVSEYFQTHPTVQKTVLIGLSILVFGTAAIGIVHFARMPLAHWIFRQIARIGNLSQHQFSLGLERTENIVFKVIQKIYDDHAIAPISNIVTNTWKRTWKALFIPVFYQAEQLVKLAQTRVERIVKNLGIKQYTNTESKSGEKPNGLFQK